MGPEYLTIKLFFLLMLCDEDVGREEGKEVTAQGGHCPRRSLPKKGTALSTVTSNPHGINRCYQSQGPIQEPGMGGTCLVCEERLWLVTGAMRHLYVAVVGPKPHSNRSFLQGREQ